MCIMLKYVLARFHGTNVEYCFWTHLDDLKKKDTILVETINGIKTAKVVGYTNDTNIRRKANKWVLCKLDIKKIKSNLKIEVEELGLDFDSPRKEKSAVKPFIDVLRDSATSDFRDIIYGEIDHYDWRR